MTTLFMPASKKPLIKGSRTRIKLTSPKILGPYPKPKDLFSERDFNEHYDLDGVSLAWGIGVIVASDASNDFSLLAGYYLAA